MSPVLCGISTDSICERKLFGVLVVEVEMIQQNTAIFFALLWFILIFYLRSHLVVWSFLSICASFYIVQNWLNCHPLSSLFAHVFAFWTKLIETPLSVLLHFYFTINSTFGVQFSVWKRGSTSTTDLKAAQRKSMIWYCTSSSSWLVLHVHTGLFAPGSPPPHLYAKLTPTLTCIFLPYRCSAKCRSVNHVIFALKVNIAVLYILRLL